MCMRNQVLVMRRGDSHLTYNTMQHLSLIISFLIFLLILSPPAAKALVKLPPGKTVPAVLVFGDSIVDAGNNNHLTTTFAKSNFPPYGKDFPGGVPTGRFCNGRVPGDLIAEELGIKSVVPAYLDPSVQPHDLLTGVTFASGGAGYYPPTSQLASAIPLSKQLEYLEEYISKVKAVVGENRTQFILENSIFLVVAGSDDIANTYFGGGFRKIYDADSFTDLVVNYAADFAKDLYNLGARRVSIFSAPPIGCVPSQRTIAGGITRDCVAEYNSFATLYNSKLSARLDSLTETLPSSRIIYTDVYNTLLNIIQNPKKYGFEVATKGCCGTGYIEVTGLCNKLVGTCPDDTKYVFWDSFHPTEKTYKAIILDIIEKYVPKFL